MSRVGSAPGARLVVLRPLDGLPQGAVPPGDQPHHPAGGHPESRRALTGIQHPQPPTRPGPDIKKPPAGPHSLLQYLHESRQRRPDPIDRVPHLPVPGVHPLHKPFHPLQLQVLEAPHILGPAPDRSRRAAF